MPLVFLFWPITLPAYVYVRSLNGARIHWTLGLLSMMTVAALVALGFMLGRYDYLSDL